MSEDYLTPEEKYEEALAAGDPKALQIQEIHQLSILGAEKILRLAAEHYMAAKTADFWKAAEILDQISEGCTSLALAARITVHGVEDPMRKEN